MALLLSLALFPADSAAQEARGEIRLQVKDASGVPMQASGKLHGASAGMDKGFQTGPDGVYTFRGLAYGRYHLEVARSGFVTQALDLQVVSPAAVSPTITMELGKAAFVLDVASTTPLQGTNLSLDQIASPVQTATGKDIADSNAIDLSEFLNRRLNGVHVNETQGNPFQPDVNFRGYTASPVLGTPEGLSIYMDGVRQNQPFGDVVAWDLLPRFAIAEMVLIPGSDPLFGLNTLGGAISVQTKDGYSQPGTTVQATGGQYGRRAVQIEHGGSNSKELNWYLGGNLYREDGWRDNSPSEVRQSFGKLGYQRDKTIYTLSGGYAGNWLTGNGLQEQRFLARDYASIYTLPDTTRNHSPFVNLGVRHTATAKVSLSGNAYFRYIRADTLNADLNEDSLDQSLYQPSAADIRALTAAGYTGFPTSGANAANTPFPKWRCIAQALLRDEPAEKCNGILTNTYNKQNNYGLTAQLSWLSAPRGFQNQFTAGAAYDRSSTRFQQLSQLGYVNADRSVTPVAALADGSTNVDGQPFDTRVNLHGRTRTWSLYGSDTLTAGKWNFTVSGRFNQNTLDNDDRLDPVPGPGSLTSSNLFRRFNPAAGVTWSAFHSVNFYASYREGSRAPTSIELGCADPTQPCRLPNALAGDPPLKQVVTRTGEVGVRGGQENGLHWSAGWFRAGNRDDLLFVSSPQTGFGYFKNFGETRRQGAEIDLSSRWKRLTLGGGYTFLDATYQSAETVSGSANSSNDAAATGLKGFDGVIQIHPGNRIPLIPRHLLKSYADLQVTSRVELQLDFVANSRSFARGNENNQSQADGNYYLGPGTSPGYGVLNLGAHYQVQRRVRLFVQVNNLLDHRYYTGAQLGPTGFSDQGSFLARPLPPVNGEYPVQHATFYAPGSPLTVSGGVRVSF